MNYLSKSDVKFSCGRLVVVILIISFFSGILHTNVAASEPMANILPIAVSANVPPCKDWSNGTLFHLKNLQHFIPIDIQIITDFSTLSNYKMLFLDKIDLTNTEVAQIRDWTNRGGVLVCIGQSGMYNTGQQRATQPLSDVLGVNLNSWQRNAGSSIGYITYQTNWQWWSKGTQYSLCYHLVDQEVRPQRAVNVSISTAEVMATFTDTSDRYPTPAITRNSYGAGSAYLISADIFWLIGYNPTYPTSENIWIGTDFHAPLQNGFPTLMMDLLAIIYDKWIPTVVVTTMPYNYLAAMGWDLHLEGGYGGGPQATSNADVASNNCYANLLQWRDRLFSKYPQLKGDFWNFMLITTIVDGTSNSTNIRNFVQEWGTPGSHSNTHTNDPTSYLASYQKLHEWYPGKTFGLDCPGGGGMGVDLQVFYDIWSRNNGNGLRGYVDQSGAPYFSIPYPVCNDTSDTVLEWAKGWGGQDWSKDIAAQKAYGANYGFGGYAMTNSHDYETGSVYYVDSVINQYINDGQVWKVGQEQFMEWWNARWQVKVLNYADTGGSVTMQISTPEIGGLTFLLSNMINPKKVYVDGNLVGQTKDRITLNFTSGQHAIVFSDAPPPENWHISILSQPVIGGFTDPSGDRNVPYDASLAVSASPNFGYEFEYWLLDGAISSYSPHAVVLPQSPGSNHTLEASFRWIGDTQFTINASAGTGGTISPAGAVLVTYGSSQSFVINPDPGNIVSDVLVDGRSVGSATAFTFTQVTANHTISASFSIKSVGGFNGQWTKISSGTANVTIIDDSNFQVKIDAATDFGGLRTNSPLNLTNSEFSIRMNRGTGRTCVVIRPDLTTTPMVGSPIFGFIRDVTFGLEAYEGTGAPYVGNDPLSSSTMATVTLRYTADKVCHVIYNGIEVFSLSPTTWGYQPSGSLYVYVIAIGHGDYQNQIGTAYFASPP